MKISGRVKEQKRVLKNQKINLVLSSWAVAIHFWGKRLFLSSWVICTPLMSAASGGLLTMQSLRIPSGMDVSNQVMMYIFWVRDRESKDLHFGIVLLWCLIVPDTVLSFGTVKDQWSLGVSRGRDESGEHRGFLGKWHYSVLYNGGYMTLYICQNPQTIQYQEWTWM